ARPPGRRRPSRSGSGVFCDGTCRYLRHTTIALRQASLTAQTALDDQSGSLKPKLYPGENGEVRGPVAQAGTAFGGELSVLGQRVLAPEAQVERTLLGARDRRRPVDVSRELERGRRIVRQADGPVEDVAEIGVGWRANERVGHVGMCCPL